MYLAGLALQLVKSYTPLAAAVAISVPVTIVNFVIVPRAPWIIHRIGTRWAVSGGIAVIAASALLIATMTVRSGYLVLGTGFALMAVAFSTFVPASTEAIMTAVPAERAGGASAVNELTRQIGQSLGIALGGGLTAVGYHGNLDLTGLGLDGTDTVRARSSVSGALGVAHDLGAAAGRGLESLAGEAFIHGIRIALIVAAAAAIVGALYAAIGIPSRSDPRPDNGYRLDEDPTAVDPIGTAFETT
jgi:hypothetical protein